jgi:pilus assembly protein TadC
MPGALVGIVAAAGVLATGPGDGSVHVDSDAVPLVVELVAACLAAGIPLPAALEAAGAGAADELGRRCREAAASLRAGDPAEAVFAGWRGEAALEPVARTLARVTRSGAAAADDLRRAASRLRAQSRSRALARVQRAAVMVVLPLGLCFLPAFVLVAAVPLVMGLIPNLR